MTDTPTNPDLIARADEVAKTLVTVIKARVEVILTAIEEKNWVVAYVGFEQLHTGSSPHGILPKTIDKLAMIYGADPKAIVMQLIHDDTAAYDEFNEKVDAAIQRLGGV